MADRDTIMRERQLVVAREMSRRSISLTAVHLDSGIPYTTVKSYFPGEKNAVPAVIPMSAVFVMAEEQALPLDLLSLLLPDGFQIVRVPEEIDHDELCEHMQDWLREKAAAHHPDSPGGREIAACEDKRLRGKAARLKAVA